jgi:uncharacterized peroxidase-related enzyme
MQRIQPLDREAVTGNDAVAAFERDFGFVPNSVLTLARKPKLLDAVFDLDAAVLGSGSVDPGLKRLVAYVASNAAGCRYCQAHTASFADEQLGVDEDKVRNAFLFEDSPLFDDAERAALKVAWGAGRSPNVVTDEDFDALRANFTEDECLEIVAVIALYGFYNRWNDTLKTTLEGAPHAWAERNGEAIG